LIVRKTAALFAETLCVIAGASAESSCDLMETLNSTLLAIFTVVLAVATIALAWFTKGLLIATRNLLKFQERSKRESDLKHALELIESLRAIRENQFADQLNTPGQIPQPVSNNIRELNLLARYIKDSDTRLYLKQLVQWIDNVEQGSGIGGNGPVIAKLFRDVRDRMGWSITEWRDELMT